MTLRSILVVDDDPADRTLIRRRLERTGRVEHILEASDGEEAIDTYRKYAQGTPGGDGFPPPVLILDLNMPRLDGFSFLEAFEALGGRQYTHKIVVLSSSSAPSDQERAKAFAGVIDYWVKPLSSGQAEHLADLCAD
ncbi:MAG: response regulator [Myxococcota bacterium]